MEYAFSKLNEAEEGRKHRPTPLIKLARLIACIFIVWIFMFVIAPWGEKTRAVKPLAQFIQDTGIDASALYYTEVEEASEAELNLRHTMKYMPRGK